MKSNNNKYRRSAIGFFLMVLCLIGAACGMRDEDGYAVQDGGTVKTDTSEQEKDASENGSVRIQIYTMDPDSLEAEEMSVRVETTDGLTAQIIVDAVVELFEEQGTDIGISGVEQVENTTIVDFDSTKAPLSGVGSSEETAILDCISMSLLDNLSDCQQVVFHSDGGSYESGHYGFELNEAYKWKN